jgi:glycosyltransferase involved in cell wall biosynthesis
VVVSHTLREYYATHYGRVAQCVPNGTTIRTRRPATHLSGFGLVAGGYVLYLGRFSPEKNCDLLLRVFKSLKTRFKLVLAGGSSHTDSYAAELRSQESDRIRVLDWLSGELLEEVLTNAALFVLPSDLEGASLALLDAMGAGLCVLASDTPENCELVGNAGYTFRKGDAEDLERMLTMLLSDERVRRTAGEAAQQRVKEKYLWSKITDEMHSLYLQVASERDTPRPVSGIAARSRGTA